MNEHKQPTEYPATAAEVPTYQTGSTKPPKSHVGIVAFLLGAVIFLCGISTILSLMRVNLLQKLNVQAENRLCQASFVMPPSTTEPAACRLGVQGLTLPDFWQDYQALPEGVFITYAEAGQSLRIGDILLTVNGEPVSSWESLLALLDQYKAGDNITITVHRDGANKQLQLTIQR